MAVFISGSERQKYRIDNMEDGFEKQVIQKKEQQDKKLKEIEQKNARELETLDRSYRIKLSAKEKDNQRKIDSELGKFEETYVKTEKQHQEQLEKMSLAHQERVEAFKMNALKELQELKGSIEKEKMELDKVRDSNFVNYAQENKADTAKPQNEAKESQKVES